MLFNRKRCCLLQINSTLVQIEAAKEQCITQKLSINLKRLNNTYTSLQNVSEKTEESSSDEHSEQVPDFPPPNQPLMLHLNAKTASSALGADGKRENLIRLLTYT